MMWPNVLQFLQVFELNITVQSINFMNLLINVFLQVSTVNC